MCRRLSSDHCLPLRHRRQENLGNLFGGKTVWNGGCALDKKRVLAAVSWLNLWWRMNPSWWLSTKADEDPQKPDQTRSKKSTDPTTSTSTYIKFWGAGHFVGV